MKEFLAKCDSCGVDLEYTKDMAESRIKCPECGKETYLPGVVEIPETSTALEKPMVRGTATHEVYRERLKLIRANSCYRILRGMINVGTLLMIFGVIVSLALWANVVLFDKIPVPAWNVTAVLFGTVIALGAILAARQAAMAVIDIADVLIQEKSRM